MQPGQLMHEANLKRLEEKALTDDDVKILLDAFHHAEKRIQTLESIASGRATVIEAAAEQIEKLEKQLLKLQKDLKEV